MVNDDLTAAHKHCRDNRGELLQSDRCAYFYCLKEYPQSEIREWTDKQQTAICPYCGIDSVIGSSAGFPLNQEFLARMHEHWF